MNILTATNLSKAFSGVRAVDGLSFAVPSGSLFAFLGQNGAGKSTTINMLIGLLRRDGGEISYNFGGGAHADAGAGARARAADAGAPRCAADAAGDSAADAGAGAGNNVDVGAPADAGAGASDVEAGRGAPIRAAGAPADAGAGADGPVRAARAGVAAAGALADPAALKRQIGVVFQDNVFDDFLSVEENLLLYGQLYLGDRRRARERCYEIAASLGLDEYARRQFRKLSGGQKRKAEIARALLASPRLLFLDEPTTGLDPKTRAEVWQIIRGARRETGMTVFLTTHYMAETSDADKVVIIHRGKLVAEGSPAELKSRYSHDRLLITPLAAELLERQLAERQIAFSRTADTYSVRAGGAAQSIGLLHELKDNIRFYEAVRGSMDDVFLNAVGERLEVPPNA